jgi:hypothetical protein
LFFTNRKLDFMPFSQTNLIRDLWCHHFVVFKYANTSSITVESIVPKSEVILLDLPKINHHACNTKPNI